MTNKLLLTTDDLTVQLDRIIHFLSVIHPALTAEATSRPCIEIRPILRGKKDFKLSRSLNLWDLSEKSISYLKTFLELHNGEPCCLYYSVYSFDNNADVTTQRGTKGVKGKISSNTALFTTEIVLDFDNIDYKAFKSLSKDIKKLGINPMWVYTGHGYQAHILLNERAYDKNILFYMVHLFRSKGFMCDESCVDPARVMRLPETFNCKCFVDETYANEQESPPKCEIVADSLDRYSLDDIISKLSSLPTINNESEELLTNLAPQQLKISGVEDLSSGKSSKKASETDNQMMMLSKLEYPYLNQFSMPTPITHMLAHTDRGTRNKVLGFLIRYFKMYLRLSERQSYDILKIWSENACTPAYTEFDVDFKRIFHNYNGFNYDGELTKKYGYIDFENLVELRKQDIAIPNNFFEDFPVLDGKAVRAYLAIRLLEHINKPTTQENLTNILKISERALRTTLQDLIKTKHVFLVKANRTKKIPQEYHSTKFVPSSKGSQILSFNDIKAYITELYEDGSRGNGELKLFLYMRYKFYTGDIFMTQENLGKNIGLKRNSVSVITKKLEEKYFISITKNYLSAGIYSCIYSLLR